MINDSLREIVQRVFKHKFLFCLHVFFQRKQYFLPFIFIFTVWLPAWIFLGYWFLVQFLSGTATAIATTGQSTGGVAFWAHIGGFVAGIVLIKIMPPRPRRYSYSTY